MDRPEEIEVVEDNEELGASGWKEEERFIDEDAEIFDTIMLGKVVEAVKGKLEAITDQGRDTCGVFKSFFHIFSVNQTPHCPKFVEWCVGNFSATEGVIMNSSKSKVLFPVQDLDICKSLHVPDEFFHMSQAYEE